MMHSSSSQDQRHSGYSRRDFDHSPLIVFYEVTQACGLACTHCRACAQTMPHPGELTSAESRQLIDQMAEFPRAPMLVLTGGDPLERHDIFELIAYARGAGIEVSITPAATARVTRQALTRLRDAGIGRLAVSLDGADAATHDAQRGMPGSFDRTMQILAIAADLGISLQVNTTIMPGNYLQVDALAELLSEYRIALWSVFFLVPVGRAAVAPRLSPQQYEQVFENLWRQSRRQRFAIKTTEAPQYRRWLLEHRRKTAAPSQPWREQRYHRGRSTLGLNDGKGVMFVSHTGLIHPSGFLPIVCGMFPLDHLVNVYQKSAIFRGLRSPDLLQGKCHDCEYRHLCGGSRARAYAVTGDIYAQEPDCDYIPRGGALAAN